MRRYETICTTHVDWATNHAGRRKRSRLGRRGSTRTTPAVILDATVGPVSDRKKGFVTLSAPSMCEWSHSQRQVRLCRPRHQQGDSQGFMLKATYAILDHTYHPRNNVRHIWEAYDLGTTTWTSHPIKLTLYTMRHVLTSTCNNGCTLSHLLETLLRTLGPDRPVSAMGRGRRLYEVGYHTGDVSSNAMHSLPSTSRPAYVARDATADTPSPPACSCTRQPIAATYILITERRGRTAAARRNNSPAQRQEGIPPPQRSLDSGGNRHKGDTADGTPLQ
ncbi:hypothetical protein FB567DRAFT_616188 [Paraphoma chrysanthemicola]|uniref:Uncharacterized protein n=1 Tax=Paraphoma chrysanthemicola TaxID=798071 RepID=A0A8K0QRS1_9PLEO|nr:hypothetical protein FB567DRAFT_616188 [Paraphoma chrysanthemicola]